MHEAHSLAQWLHHIENLHAQKMDFSLNRILPVAKKLGITAYPCPVMTVGGTNGKGSVVALLATALQQLRTPDGHPYRVASTTSPHLLKINERARINNTLITDLQLIEHLQIVETARGESTLTYFEFLSFAILHFFKVQQPDVIILEIGLGGRLDMMNVVDNDCAVITSIDLDHTHILGPTREHIGAEKSGIFRTGKAVICGDDEPPQSVLNHAQKLQCDLWLAGHDFQIQQQADGSSQLHVRETTIPLPRTHLKPQNVATALTALHCMLTKHLLPHRTPLPWAKIHDALTKLTVAGRQQTWRTPQGIELLLDVSHNPAGAHYLKNTLRAKATEGRTYMLFGVLKTKAHTEILSIFKSFPATWCLVDNFDEPGIASASQSSLQQSAHDLGLSVQAGSPHLPTRLHYLLQCAQANDRIVAWGSFHVVSATMRTLENDDAGSVT